MLLSRVGRFVLGLYPPFSPEDLRLTDTAPTPDGGTQITSSVEIAETDRAHQEAYQQQQHAMRDELQKSMLAREHAIYEREHGRMPS